MEKKIDEIGLSTNARFALSRGFDGFGVVWDLRVNRKLSDLFSYGFALGPNDGFCVSYFQRQPGVQMIRLRDGKEPTKILEDKSVNCVAVDPTGAVLACGSMFDQPGKVLLVNVEEGQTTGAIEIPGTAGETNGASAMALAFSADGQIVVVGCSDGRVMKVDASSQQVQETLDFPGGGAVTKVVLAGSRDRYLLAASDSADAGTTTVCWKAGAAQPVWQMPGTVSLDSRRMLGVLATTDGDVALFNAIQLS